MSEALPEPPSAMQPADLLSTARIATGLEPGSKKRVLEQIAALIAEDEPNLTQNQVFESLIARERLGSTGLGRGVAIPHGRLKDSDRTIGAFLRLRQGIDYDAADGAPVDLAFALLVPEDSTQEHLNLLATLARMFSDEVFTEKLRSAAGPEEILRLFRNWQAR